MKKLNPEAFFECADRHAERWLRHIEPMSSSSKVQFFRNSNEVSDLTKVHSINHNDIQNI